MSIVAEYWAGVFRRLDAEVNVFAQLVAHEGEKGRENEAIMARILEALVPQRFGIGSGLLIDTSDRYSRQTDIIVYDQSDEPAVLAQTTQLLFPIESVLASIEVKTTLRGDDIEDCLGKARDMRKLTTARPRANATTHPLFVVLAYRAGLRPEAIVRKFMDASDDERPDLVCVLQQGLLLGAPGSLRHDSGFELDGGLALLREYGQPIEGQKSPDMRHIHAGRHYPMVSYGGRLLLVESSRALLLFVEALVRLLADMQARTHPVLSYYVDQTMRELAWYGQDGKPARD